jgi:nitrate/nitrite-specific signal transduction histidine kinase
MISKIDQKEAYAPVNLLLLQIVFINLALFIIFTSSAALFMKNMISPLKSLRDAAMAVGQGKEYQNLLSRSNDEVGELSREFDKMTTSVRHYEHTLETEVEKRTKQLNDKLSELEKSNKLMIGRELKMIELKKKVKELEGTRR